ncbi:hypothetical protein CFAM422_008014 [Trichoderma lentiforme]|uniref:Alpha-galactosidase A n=1 Tax=Trichoderma lentiforme TaxID=1567552 RepID=A0A9P4XCB5_9HYPO|nr:hypothetical protein CFAM422_008014 [Trichoderma lentiforme]
MTTARNSNVQLLSVLVDWNDEEKGAYRFLVDGKDTKYVTVEPGVLPKDNRTFGPILIPLLPPFPPGEWNEGHVSKDPLKLKQVHQLRQNIHVVTHLRFDQTLVVKFAEFPWQMPYFEAETAVYEWLDSHGPKFIAHLIEAERVFGFVTEYVDGARFADIGDLAACQEILSRLHSLGIKHGDINKYNFLIREGKAMLVDFEASQRCNEKQELEAEYEQLEASLSDTSTRGVPYTWEDQQAFQQ